MNKIMFFIVSFLLFPDGQQIWEMEATVDKDKSQPVRIFHQAVSLIQVGTLTMPGLVNKIIWCVLCYVAQPRVSHN